MDINSNKFIIHLANHYLSSKYITFEELADDYNISARRISNLLFKGIAEVILSDSVAEAVANKVIYTKNRGIIQRRTKWEKAFEQRSENKRRMRTEKKEVVKSISFSEIDALEHQIDVYDDYFYDDEGAPTKEELIKRLETLKTATV